MGFQVECHPLHTWALLRLVGPGGLEGEGQGLWYGGTDGNQVAVGAPLCLVVAATAGLQSLDMRQ